MRRMVRLLEREAPRPNGPEGACSLSIRLSSARLRGGVCGVSQADRQGPEGVGVLLALPAFGEVAGGMEDVESPSVVAVNSFGVHVTRRRWTPCAITTIHAIESLQP